MQDNISYVTRRQRTENRKRKAKQLACFFAAAVILFCIVPFVGRRFIENGKSVNKIAIPEYSGEAYHVINDNKPFFEDKEKTTETFEHYSELDSLGRCGTAYANVSRELMPTEERGQIGSVKPTGWKQAKYEGIVDSSPPYLYNRCHLIAYSLTAENANERNLITGTRYMNIEGMLPFETRVARYLDENNHHVLYRVTPVFEGNELVARGVLMEAYSVEDQGEGISFCVFVHNVQPGIEIDYVTGENWRE